MGLPAREKPLGEEQRKKIKSTSILAKRNQE